VTLLALALLSFAPAAVAGGGQAVLMYGQKSLDNDFSPVEDQDALGVAISFQVGDWPVMLAVDIITSDDAAPYTYTYGYSGYTYDYNHLYDVETMEIDLGVRKFFGNKLRGYVGGGLAYLDMDAKNTLQSADLQQPFPVPALLINDSDSTIGYFLNVGGQYNIGKGLTLGIDLRYSDGSDWEIGFTPEGEQHFFLNPGETVKVSSSSTTITGFVGFRWGQ
jgi:opacity protein-like surface antigen